MIAPSATTISTASPSRGTSPHGQNGQRCAAVAVISD